MYLPTPLELDILSTVARIHQARNEPSMADYLLWRLDDCDVPRLLRYVSPEAKAWAESLGVALTGS